MSNSYGPYLDQNTPIMEQSLDFLTRKQPQQMRLERFERDFLPFFNLKGIEKEIVQEMLDDLSRYHGGLKQTEKDLVGNLMTRWLDAVRSPTQPTEIIENDGTVVYVVPPILNSEGYPTDLPGTELCQLIETAGNQYNVLPISGDNFVKERILPHVKSPEMSVEDCKLWNVIFDRYGMPRYTIPGEEVPKPANAVNNTNDDPDAECEYELD